MSFHLSGHNIAKMFITIKNNVSYITYIRTSNNTVTKSI